MIKIGRNDPCWCGSGRKYKQCHEEFDRKIEMFEKQGHIVPEHRLIKTPDPVFGQSRIIPKYVIIIHIIIQ